MTNSDKGSLLDENFWDHFNKISKELNDALAKKAINEKKLKEKSECQKKKDHHLKSQKEKKRT